jgi:transcription antitermination factor NusG
MAYWVATQLQPRRERVAEHFLRLFGFEVYLPRVRRYQIRWHRRIETLRPYFPGYGFTRIELQWHSIKQVPGVIRVVQIGADEPARVPDEVIDALRARERDGAIDPPEEKSSRRLPKVGDRLQVVHGPFAGHSGLCAAVSGRRVDVLLLIFKTARRVEIERSAVRIV